MTRVQFSPSINGGSQLSVTLVPRDLYTDIRVGKISMHVIKKQTFKSELMLNLNKAGQTLQRKKMSKEYNG